MWYPYVTYKDCESDWKHRRNKNWKALDRTAYMKLTRLDDGVFQITINGEHMKPLASIDQDDVVTIHIKEHYKGAYLYSRLKWITGCRVFSNKRDYGSRESWVRVYSASQNVPLTDGLKFRHREILNPEIAVDRVRRIDLKKAAEVRRSMKPFATFCMVLARLQEEPIPHWWKELEEPMEWGDFYNSAIEADIANPTAEAATKIMQVGRGYMFHPVEAARFGLKKLREHLYWKHGAYFFEEIKPEEPLAKAA